MRYISFQLNEMLHVTKSLKRYIVHTLCTRVSGEHIGQILFSYSVPKLRYGPPTLNNKTCNTSHKIILKRDNINCFCLCL